MPDHYKHKKAMPKTEMPMKPGKHMMPGMPKMPMKGTPMKKGK